MDDSQISQPTNDDGRNMQDPAHPLPDEPADESGQGAGAGVDDVDDVEDQDAEPTMNAPDGLRPDGLDTGDESTGGDGSS